MRRHCIISYLLITFYITLSSCSPTATYLFGEARGFQKPLHPGNIAVPHSRSLDWQQSSELADSIFSYWADQGFSDWQEHGKTSMPRKLLGNLLCESEIEAVNRYIQELEPWGTMGSTWALHRSGDYDFTLTVLTTILYLFDDREALLYPETKKHMLDVLLIAEGEDFVTRVPRTLGLIHDTENHLLMGEGSRYLKNRYLMLHGDSSPEYNNRENGLEQSVLFLLDEINTKGLYEFNSVPYLGYTITALLNLEAFASESVRSAAREALDLISYTYALGSYKFRYYPPFRRRLERASIQSLSMDYQTPMVKAWLSFLPDYRDHSIENGMHHALLAASLPYRPPDEVVDLVLNNDNEYFVQIGHGRRASPEIYSSGAGYLLSAGGVARGRLNSIVARPICLFLDDDAKELSEVIHIKGKSKNFMYWNNTGVYKSFACSDGEVHVPGSFDKLAENELWEIYAHNEMSIAVHSGKEAGIIAVFREAEPRELAAELLRLNPDAKKLRDMFVFPGGERISYELIAPKRKWVIKAIDGRAVDREYERWALIRGQRSW